MENYLEFAYDAPHNEINENFLAVVFKYTAAIFFNMESTGKIDEIVSQKSHKNTKNISQVQKILKM